MSGGCGKQPSSREGKWDYQEVFFLISPLHEQELPVTGLSENGVPELQEGPADCRASHSGIPASQMAQHQEHTAKGSQ